MTDLYHTIILALVQGATEFLPISSSAHLVLLPSLLGWKDQGLVQDVAMHFGTLLAVLVYYRRELARIAGGGQGGRPDYDVLLKLGIASIPVFVCGYIFSPWISTYARAPEWIAVTTIVFALVLLAANYSPVRSQRVTYASALLIGMAQAVALVPGVSRMGAVLSMALLLGIARGTATRFSLLLAIPVILGANLYTIGGLSGASLEILWVPLVVGFTVAFGVALMAIGLLIKIVESVGLVPFVVYRLLLGSLILIVL